MTVMSTKLSFHTKMAFGLSAASLLLLLGLSVVYRNDKSSFLDSDPDNYHRQLDENNNNNNNNDFSSYSCGHIYSVTPTPGKEQCAFAHTCNDGAGVWAPFVFCTSWLSSGLLQFLLSPIMALWLVVLFRMLGSTAEDYFSPALEMFSIQLGLPPRFAGVTLLALGNGAADVSATVSAITSDPGHGYKLSLGALTGAAMFIGCVVSASVIIAADGVYCRGALVRDVLFLCTAIIFVWLRLRTGTVGPDTISLFLSFYAFFVVLVLVADVYHRAIVLPRRAELAQQAERRRQLADAERVQQQLGTNNAHMTTTAEEEEGEDGELPSSPRTPRTGSPLPRITNIITALSNYDRESDRHLMTAGSSNGWGVESDNLGRPVMLHGAQGILNTRTAGGGQHHRSPDGTGGGSRSNENGSADGGYSMLEDAVDHTLCDDDGRDGLMRSLSGMLAHASSPTDTFSESCYQAKVELRQHANTVWEDIVWNGDVHPVEKVLLLCELPFTAARKMTVPIPCEGYYMRSLLVVSMALSSVWFAGYLYRSNDINVFSFWPYYLGYWILVLMAAMAILRYAPPSSEGGEPGMLPLWVSVPVALYGFVIAATWIDTIADSLVSLLNFIGIILSIPSPVLGLTLLAWGNSMSDLSANVTMARKGLANMAMTACYAGPVFNILVGLGLGFSSLAAKTGVADREVELSPSVLTGILFITLNTVSILTAGLFFGKGRIIRQYGYVSLCLYGAYVITSISLQYSKYGDNNE